MRRAALAGLGALIAAAAMTPLFIVGVFEPHTQPDVQWAIRVVVVEQ